MLRNNTLIIAYGNPLRGDDAAGPYIAERLEQLLPPDRATIFIRHQLTPELAEPVSEADLVVFIDASVTVPPGVFTCTELSPDAAPTHTTHRSSPEFLLAMGELINNRRPRALVVAIGARDFGVGAPLSPAVDRAARRALRFIHALLDPTEAAHA